MNSSGPRQARGLDSRRDTPRWLGAVVALFALFASACSSNTTLESIERDPAAAVEREGAGEQAGEAGNTPDSGQATPAPDASPSDESDDIDDDDDGGDDDSDVEPDESTDADLVDERRPYTFDLAPWQPTAEWDQPLPVNPSVRRGELENGLRYLLLNNDAPGGQAQLRLVVAGGSAAENEAQSGVAHFLEHMLFNGTEGFPANELVQVLESFGTAFGADVNAYTSLRETVYQLEVPNRIDSFDTAVQVLREWASRATIDADAVVDERGVVRAEYRQRAETVFGRVGELVRSRLLAGTAVEGREPIGDADAIDAMTAETVRGFYDSWYRPDLMTIVVVGDVSVERAEERIVAEFADLAAVAGPETPTLGDVGPLPAPIGDVFTDPELTATEIQLLWRVDIAPTVTLGDVRAEIVEDLAVSILSRRLGEAALSGDAPFDQAGAGLGGLSRDVGLGILRAEADAEDLAASHEYLLTALEQLRQHGVAADEFERGVGAFRALLDQSLAESASRQDRDFATELVDHAVDGTIPAAAADRHAAAVTALGSITADDVRRWADARIEAPAYTIVLGPASEAERLPTIDALNEQRDALVGTVVDPPADAAPVPDTLMEPPAPAPVIDDRRIDAIDTRVVTFANGLQMALKQTDIVENVVLMRGESNGGFFAEEGPAVPLLATTAGMVDASGFERIDTVTLGRYLSDAIVSLDSTISRTDESISGSASADDLETLLQLVHLRFTEPVIDEVQVDALRDRWESFAEDATVEPALAAEVRLWQLRYGDSPWFRRAPTADDLADFNPDRQLEAYQRRFSHAGDFVFAVVGDYADEDALIELGARYLGTLPAEAGPDEVIARDPGLPEENLVDTVEAGIGERGLVILNWESPYELTLKSELTAQALELVVNARLRDVIREDLGAAYSPSARMFLDDQPQDWIDTSIDLEVEPERVAEVSDVLRAELQRLRDGELEPRYLDNAIDVMTERFSFFSNEEWLDRVLFHVTNPDRPATEIFDRRQVAAAITIDDISAAAQLAFPESRSVEIRLVPAN